MFEAITDSIRGALSLIDRGRLTESNIREGLRQVRQALLEADVNYEVARDFIDNVTQQAVGEQVLKSLRPSEQIVGIVYQELVNLMGPVDHSLQIKRDGISILMMCGLQGSGKTTTCGKLAKMLREQGVQPMLVAADLQRPAAIEQLKIIGEQIGVPVYSEDPAKSSPLAVCRNAVADAKNRGNVKVIILDTAGRLHVDDDLMRELELIDSKVGPDQALLVCDAMTGQDAVRSAKAFNDALELDGVILTKLDGDTRGGAALSVKAVTGVPIKYIGVGEQLDRLEEFHPDRMASRILGGGDLATLLEKAQREFDADEMMRQQELMRKGKYTLEEFRDQFKQIRRIGTMKQIFGMIPGLGGMLDSNPDVDPEVEINRIEAMINSMTPDERRNPDKIDRSRRNRIARGSGTEPSDVHQLIKQFQGMSGVMQQMAGMGLKDRLRAVRELADAGMMNPNAQFAKEKQRSKRGPLDAAKAREKKKKQRKDARKARKRNR
ncbi:MAG TPA: signal recognition particle protein [Planctomycetaceae bacterium]|nr:signal recognition particle protein [Planctomycetaceae bacterium]